MKKNVLIVRYTINHAIFSAYFQNQYAIFSYISDPRHFPICGCSQDTISQHNGSDNELHEHLEPPTTPPEEGTYVVRLQLGTPENSERELPPGSLTLEDEG